MLCCVSRKSVEGTGSRIPPLIPLRVSSLNNSRSKQNILTLPLAKDSANQAKCLDSLFPQKSCKLNDIIEEDEVQELQPCTICGRTFKPQSLEKHARICEQSATKKRKPFDSAKQRIQGTELEEFLPKEPKKKIYTGEERRQINNPSWKQTHDEFIKTIRAARADSNETTIPTRQLAPLVNTGAPTRANETGACPTCNRQFGIKAYDRHVAWCKERVTRMSSTPATNMAKERLEARMKYRAPAIKNRRITNREKYSPTSKNTNLSPIGGKAKGTISLPSCSKPLEYNHSNNNLKQPMLGKKNGNLEKSDINVASSLSKSRSRDRSTNRSIGDAFLTLSSSLQQSTHLRNDKFPESPTISTPDFGASRKSRRIINSSATNDPPMINNNSTESNLVNSPRGLITWRKIATNNELIDEQDCDWIMAAEKFNRNASTEDSVNIQKTFNLVEHKSKSESSMDSSDFFKQSHSPLLQDQELPDIYSIDENLCISPQVRKNITQENSPVVIFENISAFDEIEKINQNELISPKTKNLSDLPRKVVVPSPRAIQDTTISTDSVDSVRHSDIQMRKKMRKKMNLLRESTDSLVSSFDMTDDRKKRSETSLQNNLPVFPSIGVDNKWQSFSQSRRRASYCGCALRYPKNRSLVQSCIKPSFPTSPVVLPPVISVRHRSSEGKSHSGWSTHNGGRPDFSLILKDRTGMGSSKDCDPFLLAEKQMLDLLSDTCSDKSFPDCHSDQQISSSPYYLSHMSAFAKYPKPISLDRRKTDKRDSLEFDDLSAGGFSSDSTETNSITHERFLDKKHATHNGITSSSNSNDNSKNTKNNNTESNSTVITNRNNDNNKNNNNNNKSDNYQPILGRRVIIDKSKALGQISDVFGEEIDLSSNDRQSEKIDEKTSSQYIRPLPNRSNSVRAASAPKFPERKKPIIPNNRNNIRSNSGFSTRNNDNYSNISGSNLSLSSIVSSEIEMKRSGSVFEDLVSSFEDDVSGLYPSLRSLLKSDSLCSPILSHPNASLSDDLELSSPDNCNSKADHTKISADSAYSSLNRKYFNGRSASSNHPAGKREEDSTACRGFRDQTDLPPTHNSKMSKFCHECGHKFPETAKFCCECGIQRLML